MSAAAGIYLHIPFCRSRCSYCDFATDVFKNEETVERYVSALVKEIQDSKFKIQDFESRIDTIYFGGGHAFALAPRQLEKIPRFDLQKLFRFARNRADDGNESGDCFA